MTSPTCTQYYGTRLASSSRGNPKLSTGLAHIDFMYSEAVDGIMHSLSHQVRTSDQQCDIFRKTMGVIWLTSYLSMPPPPPPPSRALDRKKPRSEPPLHKNSILQGFSGNQNALIIDQPPTRPLFPTVERFWPKQSKKTAPSLMLHGRGGGEGGNEIIANRQ